MAPPKRFGDSSETAFGKALLSPIISGLTESWSRNCGYRGNQLNPNLLPPAAALIEMWRWKMIGDKTLEDTLACHGIDVNLKGNDSVYQEIWNKSLVMSYSQIGVDAIQELYRMGVFDDREYRFRMMRAGYDFDRDGKYLSALNREPLPLTSLVALFRRGFIPIEKVYADLKQQGVTEDREQVGLVQSADFVPSVDDVLQFATRDVDNVGNLINGLLDNGFQRATDGPYGDWLKWNGIDNDTALKYWRASRKLPSQGEATAMLYRLRPDNQSEWQDQCPNALPMTDDRFASIMSQSGVAAGYIAEMACVARPVPNIRHIRLLYKTKVWDHDKVVGGYRNIGYSLADATALGEAMIADVRQDNLGPLVATAKGKIFEGLRIGAITDAQAASLLQEHGLTEDEIRISLENEAVERQISDVKAAQAAIHKMRLSGALTQEEILNQLIGIGTRPERAAEFMFQWNLELQSGHKQLTAGEVIRLYVEGLLTYEAAYTRLDNIGYLHADIELLLTEGQQKILLARARALVALAKTEAKRQQALVAQARAAAAEHRQARSELARHGSPGQLAKWYVKGLITKGEAIDRLLALDWPYDDAERMLDEALLKAPQKQPPAHPALPPVVHAPKPLPKRQLTEAQVVKGVKTQLFSVSVGLSMLENLGLSPEDAKIVLEEGGIKV